MNPAANPLALFDTQATQVETDLSGDDFLSLCGNTAWRITWLERSKKRGYQWRVKAERVTSSPAGEPELRLPYRDD
jgi:hypothetical protein